MQKRILIVGGSRGIGAALVDLAAGQNHEVHIISRSEVEVTHNITSYVADVTEDDLPEVGESLDALIYCPGSINLKPFSSLREQVYEDDFKINVLGFLRVLKKYESALKAAAVEDKTSAVVAFSTVAVQTGMPYHTSVAATKGAVEGIVRSLAAEWSPKIRVNAIAPSLVDTPLASRLLRNEKQRRSSEERHPLKRIGSAQELAQAAYYLIKDDSSWMTGQVLKLDGGMSSVRIM